MSEKPQLGVCPYYVIAESRIIDLTMAINRCLEERSYENVKEWAKEIYLQADLLLQMGKDE